ncbi:hypothetical protein Nepgr_027236 [Nepenthes gracilis]|uniref:Uncharacterized protein n=1 Tax=Nepenthes gracilis TaxID=150966 RepID=A0AAD3Y1A6_NEPGR|nr:hypothetical protein Nepgr_027236 [Nepenthes gracilis]
MKPRSTAGKPPTKRDVPKWRLKPSSCVNAVHNVVENPRFCLAKKSFASDLGVAPALVSPSVAVGPCYQIANAVDQIEGSPGEALSAELNDCEAGWDNAAVFGEYGCLGHGSDLCWWKVVTSLGYAVNLGFAGMDFGLVCWHIALRVPSLTSARFGMLSPINDVNNANWILCPF